MSESNSKRTILEMLEQGKITQEQAGQLLVAMEDEEGTEREGHEEEASCPLYIESGIPGCCQVTVG